MSWEPVPDPDPRFVVLTIEGYPIYPSGQTSAKPVLSATVFDRFYRREMGTIRSTDRQASQPREPRVASGETCPECGGPKHRHGKRCRSCAVRGGAYSGGKATLGYAGALAAAGERCAELNAWHEREGWGE